MLIRPELCGDVPGRGLFCSARFAVTRGLSVVEARSPMRFLTRLTYLLGHGQFASGAFSLALFDAACHFVLVAVFAVFGSNADEDSLGVVGELLFGEFDFVV